MFAPRVVSPVGEEKRLKGERDARDDDGEPRADQDRGEPRPGGMGAGPGYGTGMGMQEM